MTAISNPAEGLVEVKGKKVSTNRLSELVRCGVTKL